MWGADDPNWTYTVVNGDASKLNTTKKTFTIDETHVFSYADTEVASGSPTVTVGSASSTYGLKFGSSGSVYFNPVILSTNAFKDYAITKVSLYLKHNGSKAGSLTVKQGDVTIGTKDISSTSSWTTVTCSETKEGEGGTLEIKYEVAQALYINKIEVWYKDLSGTKHTLSSAVNPSATGTVTLGSNSILEGKSTTILAEPADGYYFVNWTYTGTGASVNNVNTASTTFTMGTSDATVTANFAEINYWAVTYDYNDGVTEDEEVRVLKTEADSYNLKAAPSREGYNFTGWKIGETTYAAGASYEPTADVTVQAQWEFDGTLITYNKSNKNDLATGAKYVMGASYTSSGTTTWKYCQAMGSDTYLHADVVGEHGTLDADKAVFYDETPEVITLNETEDGWTMTNESGKKIGLKGDKQLGYDTGDQTWDLGGTDNIPTFSAQYTKNGTLTTYIMKFNWNSGSSRFNAYTSGQQDVYFYRLDNGKNVYTLTLDFNDGATNDGTHRVLEGANYTLTAPTRNGYVFMGWNTEEDGTGTNYEAGAYAMPAVNTTLYAQWATTTTITLNAACTDGNMVYGTFSFPRSFVVPEDIIVSEIGIVDGKLYVEEYSEGDIVPANTGVMVSSLTGGNYDVTLSNAAGTSVLGNDNRLRGTGAGITASEMDAADANCKFYRLTMHGYEAGVNPGVIGFWWGAAEGAAFAIASNKAYLAVANGGSAKEGFSFGTDTAETDRIRSIENEKLNIETSAYNLAGQRVGKDYKGIVVVNGKKMLNK